MTDSSRFGCPLAPALLCFALTGSALAAPGSAFTLTSDTPKMLTPAALTAALKTETPGQSSQNGRTLTFAQKTVRLVDVTGPDDDMLSYRIGGKRNPTLIVPRGATLKLLFVNTDDDMFHDIRFGAASKTYPKSSVGTSELPHKTETALHGEELTLRVPNAPGAYAYFCTVRGHAQGGMVGAVLVR